ncbi:MAG TPA: cysteine hydrolase [Trebonia sp.]|jgi:ureidoacrylate peracid hydrolase|nr:cysteine hydrolase [Trebonia sp.]
MSTPADVIPGDHAALLFFDMLNGHIKTDDGEIRERYLPVIPNAVKILDAARAAGLLIAYAAANHRADNGTTATTLRDTDNRLRPVASGTFAEPLVRGGTWQSQIIDELAPRPADYMIPKYRWSAFHQTYLDLALRTRGIRTIILCGGSTDVGVASTAYAARDLDYNLVIPADACVSPEKDNHDQFMNRIFPRMARVRTADQIAAMLAG